MTINRHSEDHWLKLGVIYFNTSDVSQFLPLLVLHGDDGIDNLNHLLAPGVTTFEDDSARYSNIFQVLQSFTTRSRAKFVSDWKFLNALKAIMQPGSTIYPCPICLVCGDDFCRPSRARRETDKHSRLAYQPLLTIPVEDIVPLPLHVMLGFVNKINKE